ncbi:UDP-N-acetylglucosamine--N-acetylmuramyl-(pentapeptide) pyrophosphoryl-undecaprenol N-acetylglucosamine transferase [Sphingobium jiangsuense]|uniref:UDP-N-acetylglucosamine--N-acetylmuramyl-(pentapeptide) pyrophosphoryl-undecaprenol N-acetylglucosamine transferase n=1 Tax=Sphingobium jiangsuense TaxID=870476 RepID=A0A7W6FPY5_9SPHN|nr:undecaprenyldiphospho-muramoylpentapeptide beta-N-acetylglucosaminyltransferase [Sphingobium jiangsuense]MBB3926561.1 UDP-N-acetylglucosamine--N-acetylmuramyl-(pentapeptide) pyrophosphoryl-undecaprenol N-acetylglucosamine transferase [Sphingobium jiangsuense]GLT02190.1 UDP-N-acetylglucosamine--N-acetylmuramyl-(pentapeptide) pyrophosphoryl-undecaprenol N-acetylglucosamine transferase [Sphingobium jiangsuense]
MTVTRHFVLAAGGTGGHMIPAHAVAEELMARGHHVALVTDERGAKIPGIFRDAAVHVLPAGRMQGGPLGWVRGLRGIITGRDMARRMYETFRPSVVVGFGGYPALPALLGALKDGIPTVVHEQNAVLGRVNRLLARKVNAIATAYPDVQRLKPKYDHKVHLVGNPVREEVLALRDEEFPALTDESVFRLLVTGGSQGASILSEVVPEGLSLLPISLRRRLQVTQQCRAEDIERVRATYAEMEIPADLATYINDIPEKLNWAHLVIARAGASTLAELTVAGRPAILIPLPSAMDDHQTANVRELVEAGGARSIPQSRFTPVELAKQMQKMAMEPGALQNAARRAWNCGRPNAARDMADLLESIGTAPLMNTPVTVKPVTAPAGLDLSGAPA